MSGKSGLVSETAREGVAGRPRATVHVGGQRGGGSGEGHGHPGAVTHLQGPTGAVDPRDSDHVYVATADLQTATCHVYRSTDGGASFTELEGPDFGELTDCGLNRGGLPQNMRMKLVVDAEGVVYWALAAADPAAGGARNVVLARSDDDGASWETTTVAEGPRAGGPRRRRRQLRA